ncbi:hypothetical protein [Francisella tularensis]|uniref:hypothetical protein n=1 Tax=Francisella tularensis TaxID=263 RepID=UPI0014025C79|nr:hypothetical protein [Francisella tularensis]WKL71417.1 hypothetical protein Q1H05_04090 [Francisella tularensis subsp. mediasiatica]MBK2037675.1 hypothetical protein [Francisella tularensis subsp. tularensis]MBK2039570.1 hypothetical protein [Francisella tularensis subsp. tularensis]MBK2041665.1 hypothetical protein [Francisella tularensis subsp. tularensis]MBK2062284.1 hypothetical protein [Francisella tularensis subsp. tularensis]
MMAFLLDIITFLQISFSTNIFRINYNTYKVLYLLASIRITNKIIISQENFHF